MRLLSAAAILALASCATTPAAPDRPGGAARTAEAFFRAVEAEAWDDAYSLLSERWRARLTPARLAADREQGGALAADRLARARRALDQPAAEGEDEARFPIGAGKELRLVRESGGWRMDALE